MTLDVKMQFCVPELSNRKIILHQFHNIHNEDKSGIGYDIIIGRDLMVQLVLPADFNCQVLQRYVDTVSMKKTAV